MATTDAPKDPADKGKLKLIILVVVALLLAIGLFRRNDHFTGAPWLAAIGACAPGSRYTSTTSGLGKIEQALSRLRLAASKNVPARR